MIEVVQKCWINGVSTRKIENIARKIGIESLRASEISEINHGLDEMVYEFWNRRLEAEYPAHVSKKDNDMVAAKLKLIWKAPDRKTAQKLITSYLIEYAEDWQSERSYISAEALQSQREILFPAA